MWDTFNKVRNRLTMAEWDQVFMEVRGEREFDETREIVIKFTDNLKKALLGRPITEQTARQFDLLCMVWQQDMLYRGYTFIYRLDTPDLYYREFTLGGRIYSLMIAFINGHQNMEIRFR